MKWILELIRKIFSMRGGEKIMTQRNIYDSQLVELKSAYNKFEDNFSPFVLDNPIPSDKELTNTLFCKTQIARFLLEYIKGLI